MKNAKIMKNIKRVACLFFALALLFISTPVQANEIIKTEDLDLDVHSAKFADDRVLVVMTQDASLEFDTYNTEDFSEIDCVNVTDLTVEMGKLVQQKISKTETAAMAAAYEKTASDFMAQLDVDAYKQVLCIELNEAGTDNVLAAIKTLSQRDDVYSVGPDYVMYADSEKISARAEMTSTNDAYYNQQWGLSYSYIPNAWNLVTTTNTILVGVIDTGIDAAEGSHPDLSGRVNTSLSRSFLMAQTEVGGNYDAHGHGTHVAGIIAATSNNGIGIAGTAGTANVKLVSLQAMDDEGCGYASNVILAIQYAATLNIPVINMSLGYTVIENEGIPWPYRYDNHSGLYQVMSSYPGLFVCSAGNDNRNTDLATVNHYPSEYDLDNIISVGAYTSGYTMQAGTNYGLNSVDIFAPGGAIISCMSRLKCSTSCTESGHVAPYYHYKSGTSMATPFVTGIAALIKLKYPNITPADIRKRFIDSAIMIDELDGYCTSCGILDAYMALA